MPPRATPLRAEVTRASPAPDRRTLVRYRCAPNTRAQVSANPQRPPYPAEVLELSAGTIQFVLDSPADSRGALLIEMRGWHKEHRLLARVAQVHCQDGRWLHDCDLVVPLTADQLSELLAGE